MTVRLLRASINSTSSGGVRNPSITAVTKRASDCDRAQRTSAAPGAASLSQLIALHRVPFVVKKPRRVLGDISRAVPAHSWVWRCRT